MNPNISRETVEKAISLARTAIKLGFAEPQGITSDTHGDSMTYIFTTKDTLVMVCCSPSCYLVSYGRKGGYTMAEAEYLLVKNIRTFLQTLKKKGYKSPSRNQLLKLEEEIKKSKRPEREPNDDELKDIEDNE